MINRLKTILAQWNGALPRKGRIRLVLFLLALIAVFLSLPDRKKAAEERPALNEAPGYIGSVLPFRKFKYLCREDVSELLRDYPPSLALSCDTLKFRDRRIAVHYAIRDELQSCARRLFRQYHPVCGALAAIEPSTGRVLALFSYGGTDRPLFLRNTFPSASVFKIVTASAAIETGRLSPGSLISFAGDRYTLYRYQLRDNPRYGTLTSLSEAFAYSINPVFGKIGMNMLGRDLMFRYAEKLGYRSRVPFEIDADTSFLKPCDSAYNLAELACGFNEETRMTPLLGALMTASLVEDGRMLRPSLVDSITDPSDRRIIYRASPLLWKKSLKESTAREVRGMMEKVVSEGTARKSFSHVARSFGGDMQLGGKTGSLSVDGLGKVDWFVGFGRHRTDVRQRIAVAVVAVFGPYWTVHSSYIGAEIVRLHCRSVQAEEREETALTLLNSPLLKEETP